MGVVGGTRGAFAEELKLGPTGQGQRPVCHLGACMLKHLFPWRAVNLAICWCSGRGKASVLWLMVGYVYFKRWGVPLM